LLFTIEKQLIFRQGPFVTRLVLIKYPMRVSHEVRLETAAKSVLDEHNTSIFLSIVSYLKILGLIVHMG